MTSTLPVAQSRIVARLATGDLTDVTPDEIRFLLALVGSVRMIHVGPLTTDWKVFNINGAEVDISGSTTGGLQEAVNELDAPSGPDRNLYIIGGGVINCSTTVTFPILNTQKVYMDTGVINFPGSIGSNPGIRFQTMLNCDIEMLGKIVYGGAGSCILLKAEGVTEIVTTISNTRITFTTLDGSSVANATAIEIDKTNGSFLQNRLEVMKIDYSGLTGGKGLILKSTPSFSVIQNDFYIYDLRGTNVGVQAGSTDGVGMAQNRFTVFQSTTKGTNPIGLQLHSQNSEYTYDLGAPAANTTGIQEEVAADANSYRIFRNPAATPFADNSTAKTSTFHQDGAFTGLLQMNSYTVIGAPSASAFPRTWIWVSNEVGGATPAFSDGSDWRRTLDNAVIST